MKKILYLGIDPSRYVHDGELVHYPLIQTVPIAALEPIEEWNCVTHLLFTSPSAVRHWFSLSKAPLSHMAFLSIGSGTSAVLRSFGHSALEAPFAQQEGVVELLRTMEIGYIVWPRSSLARPILEEELKRRQIRYKIIDLYSTIPIRPKEKPDLDLFDEIVFTSPTTVDAFSMMYKNVPKRIKILVTGPVTAQAVFRRFLQLGELIKPH